MSDHSLSCMAVERTVHVLSSYLIIRLLFFGEPTFVDTIVYPTVYPVIDLVDLGLQMGRIKVQRWILCYIIEFSIEHADYL